MPSDLNLLAERVRSNDTRADFETRAYCTSESFDARSGPHPSRIGAIGSQQARIRLLQIGGREERLPQGSAREHAVESPLRRHGKAQLELEAIAVVAIRATKCPEIIIVRERRETMVLGV
jgi:hypothetical protein